MSERLRRWWRYPFASAGPVSVAYWGSAALAGILGGLLLRPSLAPLPGALVLGGGYLAVSRSRKRFQATRDIVNWIPLGRRLRLEIAGVIVVIVAIGVVSSFRWNTAWLWVLFAVGALGVELDRRQTWARAGYPGDPRWAIDWDADTDPAYEGQAARPLLAKEYAQARRLLGKALELKPHDPFVLYNLACAEARLEDPDAALEHLRAATAGNSYYLGLARRDKDLASIRDDPRFPR